MLVRSFLSAGIDTTVYGLGNALYCFASYPEQWTILRENPALIRGAFEEVLRFEAPVQSFFRTTTRAVDVVGVAIGDGEKVLLLFAAANRDPRRWDKPDTFDVRRRADRAYDLRHRHSWLRRAGGGAARKRGDLRPHSPGAWCRSN